ncbi:hypothetical protein ACIBI2_04220 [Streptosporangium canum]|uniref:hypothetical protein n=1 Tax=Streptosporangium canum TaxID=324952 RepID=UPI003793590C
MEIDDQIEGSRRMGRPPLLGDSELVCLAVAQALLGYHSEARWLCFARKHLSGMFPYLPQQSGCNKRPRAALPLIKRLIRKLAMDSDFWFDNHWIVDSTPVPCGMPRPTAQCSNSPLGIEVLAAGDVGLEVGDDAFLPVRGKSAASSAWLRTLRTVRVNVTRSGSI